MTRLPACASTAAATPPPLPEPTTTTSASSVVSPDGVMTSSVLGVCGGAGTKPGYPIAALWAGQAVSEDHRKLIQRGYRSRALGRDAREVGDDGLPVGLRLILQPGEACGIDQLKQGGEMLLSGDVGADVAALGGVEPRWVVIARNRRDEGVDDRGQGFALERVEFEAHGGGLSWSVGCTAVGLHRPAS